MTKEKNDNIVVGPWENSSTVPRKSTEEELKEIKARRMRQDFEDIDDLMENIVVQIVHTLNENGFNIQSEYFARDIAFLNECVKGSIYREYGYEHPMLDLVSKLFKMEKKDGKLYTKFAGDKLAKIIKEL